MTWNGKMCYFAFSRRQKSSFLKIINLLILLTEFYTHKCKFNNKTPHFPQFIKDVNFYIKSIYSTNKSSLKTIEICNILQRFIQSTPLAISYCFCVVHWLYIEYFIDCFSCGTLAFCSIKWLPLDTENEAKLLGINWQLTDPPHTEIAYVFM